MINFVMAFLKEAKPVIEKLKLKQVRKEPFPIYANDDYRLVICGLGEYNAACAVVSLHHVFETTKEEIWINFGVAGHLKAPLGSLSCVSKLSHLHHKNSFYPFLPFSSPLAKCALLTHSHPSKDYIEDCLFDMEGYGFYFAASKYALIERIHCLKLISDNAETPFDIINFQDIEKWIYEQTPQLIAFANELKKTIYKAPPHPALSAFLRRWRFSHTQKLWVEKHFNLLLDHYPEIERTDLKKSSSKQIIEKLRTLLKNIPL